jgi:hypothetical protein
LDDSFAALVRGPSTTYPRGFPLLFPVWLGVIFAAVWIAWLRVIGPMQWWYAGALIGGMFIAGTTVSSVLATIRQPAFRADRNGIRLGLRTERKRPRNRQAHLWWSDVRQLRIEPRRYGLMVEISLGPAARILRRRGLVRQTLLWCTMLVMPFGLGRGTPRLTEPRRKDPQYRVRLYDVTPEELGLALAGLALPAVEIIVISRRYGPIMARRPQPAAPRRPAPAAAAPPAPPAATPPMTSRPATASPATAPPATAPPATAPPASAPPATAPPATVRVETAPAPAPPPAAEPLAAVSPVTDQSAVPDGAFMTDEPFATEEPLATEQPLVTDEPFATDEPFVTEKAGVTDEPASAGEPSAGNVLPGGVPRADGPAPDGALAGVPVMAAPHAGLEVAEPAEREASQPAA